MINIILVAISNFLEILSLIVFVDVILSYFMSPYHPIRSFLDRIVEPLLAPIRNVMPTLGGLDFSPMVLIIILQVLGTIIRSI